MQQRYYDPVIGRFYSNDPVDMLGHMQKGNPTMGFNRYAYANNNPYKYTDPDGEFAQVAVGALIGGVVSAGVESYKQYKAGNGFSPQKIATEGLKGAVVGGATAGVGVFMGALSKTAEVGKIATVAGETTGAAAGSIIGSGVNQIGEKLLKGDGYSNKDVNAANKEMVANPVGAAAGNIAGALVQAIIPSAAVANVAREAVGTAVSEQLKEEPIKK